MNPSNTGGASTSSWNNNEAPGAWTDAYGVSPQVEHWEDDARQVPAAGVYASTSSPAPDAGLPARCSEKPGAAANTRVILSSFSEVG